jgi:hypothetical protein
MLTRNYLETAYLERGLSLREVAAESGIDCSTVRYYMRKYGVQARTKSQALTGSKNPMYGRKQSAEVRRRIAATVKVAFADPELRAARSARVSGVKNPMYGRTHTDAVKERARLLMLSMQRDPESLMRVRHREAMANPATREAIAKSARTRVGARNGFFGKSHTEQTKEKLAAANRGRFQGSNGSNWQGGKTRLTALVRNSEDAIRWRKAVFERDAYTCQLCGKVGGPLHADHIKPLSTLLREHSIHTLVEAQQCSALWDLSNGRTLCVPCHRGTPTFAGKLQRRVAV